MSTFIIGTIIAAAFVAVGYKVYKQKKSGGCCGCDGCSESGNCHKAK